MVFSITPQDRHKTGVYSIRNKINSKVYIGSTSISFYVRYRSHISDYNHNKHHSKPLTRAFDKYGISNFEFKILCICSKRDCLKMEQWHINNGCDYNCALIAGSLLGYKHPATSLTRTVRGGKHHCSKKVYQFNVDGKLIRKHLSMIEAVVFLNKTKSGISHLTQACIGNTFSAFGYRWSFTKKLVKRRKRLGGTKLLLTKGKIRKIFLSEHDCSDYISSLGYKCNQGRINRSINKTNEKVYGFKIKTI